MLLLLYCCVLFFLHFNLFNFTLICTCLMFYLLQLRFSVVILSCPGKVKMQPFFYKTQNFYFQKKYDIANKNLFLYWTFVRYSYLCMVPLILILYVQEVLTHFIKYIKWVETSWTYSMSDAQAQGRVGISITPYLQARVR